MKEPLTNEEIEALQSIGVIAVNWYAVTHNENEMPFAIFNSEEYAKAYRDQFSATSIVEPWPLVLRDMRKGDLKRTIHDLTAVSTSPSSSPRQDSLKRSDNRGQMLVKLKDKYIPFSEWTVGMV